MCIYGSKYGIMSNFVDPNSSSETRLSFKCCWILRYIRGFGDLMVSIRHSCKNSLKSLNLQYVRVEANIAFAFVLMLHAYDKHMAEFNSGGNFSQLMPTPATDVSRAHSGGRTHTQTLRGTPITVGVW